MAKNLILYNKKTKPLVGINKIVIINVTLLLQKTVMELVNLSQFRRHLHWGHTFENVIRSVIKKKLLSDPAVGEALETKNL